MKKTERYLLTIFRPRTVRIVDDPAFKPYWRALVYGETSDEIEEHCEHHHVSEFTANWCAESLIRSFARHESIRGRTL